MDKRFGIFIVISIGIIAFSNYFTMKSAKNKIENAKIESSQVKEEQEESVQIDSEIIDKIEINDKKSIKNIKKETIKSKFVRITAESEGGVLEGIEIERENKAGEKTEIISKSSENRNFAFNVKVNGTDLALPQQNWGIEKNGSILTFGIEPAEGIYIEKKIEMDDSKYTGKVYFSIENKKDYPIDLQDVEIMWGPGKSEGKGRFSIRQIVALHNGKVQRFKTKKKDESIPVALDNGWIGMSDQYFCVLFFGEPGTFEKAIVRRSSDQAVSMSVYLPVKKIDPKTKVNYTVNVYFGPQNYQNMKEIGYNVEKVVNFGVFSFLSVPMYYLLKFFYNLTSNYGLAIILLTIIIRAILWWPTQKSYTSMKKMQSSMNKMQPRLKTLKEIYGNDPQKLNEETMKLYREYQINPMGGCLPMLLQMPVFFALFATLSSAVELKGAEFIWVWKDLSAKDPIYVLPILMGLSMFLQQKISTPPAATPEAAAQQKMMLYMMPAMLTFFSFIWPSGLLLYWVVSNILSIGQQVFINRKA